MIQKPKVGYGLFIFLFVGTHVVRGFYIYDHRVWIQIFGDPKTINTVDEFKEIYIKPWMRISPYLIGIIAGVNYM